MHLILQLGLAQQKFCLEDASGTCKSSLLKMKSDTVGSEKKEKGKFYVNCRRNAHESKIQEGDKVSVVEKRERKLSATYKQSPFTVVQKNGNSVLVEGDGVQYSRDVT